MTPPATLRAAVALLALGAGAAEPAVLHLADGGFAPGGLRGSDDPKVVRWASPLFTRPLEFPLSAVTAVRYGLPAGPPRAGGPLCFELADDDALSGELVGMTDDDFEVDVPGVGRVRLRRELVRRVYPAKGADHVYTGPSGLAGWAAAPKSPAWREEGTDLVADRPGASVFADLGLPDAALVEVELSWRRKPDFVLALGVGDEAAKYGFRLEVWDGDMVAVGESPRDADVAVAQPVGPGEGHARLRIHLDQTRGRLTLLSPAGRPLAALALGKPPKPGPGVRLTNVRGDVRLEHLRVTRWAGPPPGGDADDRPRVLRADGSAVPGRLAAYDPAKKEFTVRDGTAEVRVRRDDLAEAFLAPPPARGGDAALRVTYRDGSRFSGTLGRVEDTHLTLTRAGVDAPLRLPLAGVRSVTPLRPAAKPAPPPAAPPKPRPAAPAPVQRGWLDPLLPYLPKAEVAAPPPPPAGGDRPGWLEMDGLRLKGRVVAGGGPPDASCLGWRPDLGRNASPLARGLSGRVVFREQAEAPPPSAPAPAVGLRGQIVLNERGAPVAAAPTAKLPLTGRRGLHLRSGDAVPCEVTRIDERGVTFASPDTSATFVPHEKVKSVELLASAGGAIEEAKRDRLLTLPRAQKGAPPTHLICSPGGDVLRGRVLEMDDRHLKVEVRLEEREVPRDRVAVIVWLHADELAAAPPSPPAGADRVQAVRADGNRLTFAAESADAASVSGTSDVLGACRVALAEVDLLLFGSAIEKSAAELTGHRWKLRPAVEPRFAAGAAGGDGPPAGTESPLVGQPAPPFKLDRLGGGEFDLAARKGKVVVLDFWATWCGPCLQTLPLVDAVAREFAGKGVELVAVNLEERPEQVKPVMERLKLATAVALDRDGAAAGKYAATVIPQTVVIGRDGKVARLFVGGGQKTADALRAALQELTAKPAGP